VGRGFEQAISRILFLHGLTTTRSPSQGRLSTFTG